MKALKTLGILFGSALIMTSCSKENTASNTPSVSYQLKAINNSFQLNRTESFTVNWTLAKAQANMVKFEAKQAGSEIEFKSNVQSSIDLLSLAPLTGNITIPPGTYDEVEFRTVLAPASSNPSLELKGTITDNNGTTQISFVTTETFELRAEAHNVVVQSTVPNSAVTALDLAVLASGITAADLANASQTNGAVVISATSNANLYSRIMNKLKNLHHGELNHH